MSLYPAELFWFRTDKISSSTNLVQYLVWSWNNADHNLFWALWGLLQTSCPAPYEAILSRATYLSAAKHKAVKPVPALTVVLNIRHQVSNLLLLELLSPSWTISSSYINRSFTCSLWGEFTLVFAYDDEMLFPADCSGTHNCPRWTLRVLTKFSLLNTLAH